MVSSALWTDFDNNGWVDLIAVGQWMPISVYCNEQSLLKEVTNKVGLEDSQGWWNSIISADFDADGDTDYVAGNLGLNSLFKASHEEPVQGWTNDFDENKTTEFILSTFIQEQHYPVYPLDVMVQELTYLKYRFTQYEQYANAKTTDLFSKEKFDSAYQLRAVQMQTSFIENKGADGFHISPLPKRAQISPVYGMISKDFNHDGNLDLLLIGNNYQANSITGRYDAGTGLYLKGECNGNFKPIATMDSGFFVDGNTRALSILNHMDSPLLLATVNQDSLKKFNVLPTEFDDSGPENILEIRPHDASAIISFRSGIERKIEFTYGSGYLSQSSRWLSVPDSATTVEILNYRGNRREINTKVEEICQ